MTVMDPTRAGSVSIQPSIRDRRHATSRPAPRSLRLGIGEYSLSPRCSLLSPSPLMTLMLPVRCLRRRCCPLSCSLFTDRAHQAFLVRTRPGSPVQHPPSKIPRPTSSVQDPPSRIPRPTYSVQDPPSKIPFQDPPSKILRPTFPVKDPPFRISRLGSPV
jgi:hypothetical protein